MWISFPFLSSLDDTVQFFGICALFFSSMYPNSPHTQEEAFCRFKETQGKTKSSFHIMKENADFEQYWLLNRPPPEAGSKKTKTKQKPTTRKARQAAWMAVALSYSIWKRFNSPAISIDLMLYFGITSINGPSTTLVVILFEMQVEIN